MYHVHQQEVSGQQGHIMSISWEVSCQEGAHHEHQLGGVLPPSKQEGAHHEHQLGSVLTRENKRAHEHQLSWQEGRFMSTS